jgi:hypothetical protein
MPNGDVTVGTYISACVHKGLKRVYRCVLYQRENKYPDIHARYTQDDGKTDIVSAR